MIPVYKSHETTGKKNKNQYINDNYSIDALLFFIQYYTNFFLSNRKYL